MVCRRCILSVESELKKLGLHPLSVTLGVVKIEEESLSKEQAQQLSETLESIGFEMLDSGKSRLIERIKNIVVNNIHHKENLDLKVNWSELIAGELNMDYNYLSSLFSSVEGTTIEQYIIAQKIEKVKELLLYDELNLNEISYKLGYSSVQYLSTQFKNVTGQTPSKFKASRSGQLLRKPLDSVI